MGHTPPDVPGQHGRPNGRRPRGHTWEATVRQRIDGSRKKIVGAAPIAGTLWGDTRGPARKRRPRRCVNVVPLHVSDGESSRMIGTWLRSHRILFLFSSRSVNNVGPPRPSSVSLLSNPGGGAPCCAPRGGGACVHIFLNRGTGGGPARGGSAAPVKRPNPPKTDRFSDEPPKTRMLVPEHRPFHPIQGGPPVPATPKSGLPQAFSHHPEENKPGRQTHSQWTWREN